MKTDAKKDDPFLSDRPVVPPGKPLIEVEDLHKSFGSLHVLRGITTTIRKGEVVLGTRAFRRHEDVLRADLLGLAELVPVRGEEVLRLAVGVLRRVCRELLY